MAKMLDFALLRRTGLLLVAGSVLAGIGRGQAIPALPSVAAVACNPSTVAAGSSTTCRVTLSKAAPGRGATVRLTDNGPALTVPFWVRIEPGSSSATFTATSSAVTSDVAVTVTATYNQTSQSATVTVAAQAALSSIGCNPSTLPGGLTTTCTVKLTKAAPVGGALVALSDNSVFVTLPSSVTVASAATTATFTAVTLLVTLNQTATITASYGGTSKTATLTLTPTTSSPTLTLSSGSGTPGSTISLNLTLTYPGGSEPAGLQWTLSYSASAFTSVTMTAGPALTAAGKTLSCTSRTGSYACIASGLNTTNISAGVVAVASVRLSSGFTSGVISVVNTYAVSGAGAGITISGAGGTITANAVVTPQSITKLLTGDHAPGAAMKEHSMAIAARVAPATLARVNCQPRTVHAGEEATCQVQLDAPAAEGSQVEIISSSAAVKAPALISTRAGQSIFSFKASVDPSASQQDVIVEARLDNAVQEELSIVPDNKPILHFPQRTLARFGSPVRFTVEAVHGGGQPVRLHAAGLPSGASFVPQTGVFEWTPSQEQQGSFEITFTGSTAASSLTARAIIEVGSGAPVLSPDEAISCSPSAVARLRGKWLSASDSALADRSGGSTSLGGTRVKVNQHYVPLLYASPVELNILCPDIAPGATLEIVVETDAGVTKAQAVMLEAAPMLLTLGESSQGLITVSGTGQLAMPRNFRIAAQPAQPEDRLSIWATGVSSILDAADSQILIRLGDLAVTVDSAQSLADFAGIQLLEARVPSAVAVGEAVPVAIEVVRSDGRLLRSNTATIAIEPVQP